MVELSVAIDPLDRMKDASKDSRWIGLMLNAEMIQWAVIMCRISMVKCYSNASTDRPSSIDHISLPNGFSMDLDFHRFSHIQRICSSFFL